MAFLLGAQWGAKMCRDERFARTPNLETALALEVSFQKPVSELLGGVYQKVETRVVKRAKVLAERVRKRSGTNANVRKSKTLTSIGACGRFGSAWRCGQAATDPSPWKCRPWLTEDGLPDISITGVAQTSDGYLWVATKGGLVCFNGQQFFTLPTAKALSPDSPPQYR